MSKGQMGGKDEQRKVQFDHYKKFYTVALRILLIDDKVGGNRKQKHPCESFVFKDVTELKELSVLKCPNESCHKDQCKLCTIKRLMDDSRLMDGKKTLDGKADVFSGIGEGTDYFYWREKEIECYYCPTIITDFIDGGTNFDHISEIVLKEKSDLPTINLKAINNKTHRLLGTKETPLEIACDFRPLQDPDNPNKTRSCIDKVQIVGVRDVRTALLLLSRYKFDMVFVDYLLDKKDEDSGESRREYSIPLFEFLSEHFDEILEEESDDTKKHKYQVLEKLQRTVLANRGPLDKLWIMPITGFNSPFIQTLQNKTVPLINTRWHIENGADPITTPWQFLVKLNQFIELQLKGCVYDKDMLLKFLTISGSNIQRRLPLHKKRMSQDEAQFHDFQDLMGAEYSNFMIRFGARPLIRRDAMTGEDGQNLDKKSVFSTYVWQKFYTDKSDDDEIKRKKKILFSLHNLMQIFYQEAATMPEDRNGVLRLREAFRRLRYYVDINNLEELLTDEESKKNLQESLDYYANRIDSLLVEKEDKPRRKNK